MTKGSLIELSPSTLPKFYLWIYKFFLTQPTPVRKKKEEKIRELTSTAGDAIDFFLSVCGIAKNKIKFFFEFPNELLLKKKRAIKIFFSTKNF
jgi:hypothetical protein